MVANKITHQKKKLACTGRGKLLLCKLLHHNDVSKCYFVVMGLHIAPSHHYYIIIFKYLDRLFWKYTGWINKIMAENITDCDIKKSYCGQ